MNIKNWQSFDYWKDFYKKQQYQSVGPFRVEPITDNTVFLWNRETAPLPAAVESRMWEWFPEPKALVGYLRFVVLPNFFATWLCRYEWDSELEAFISAEDLFTRAEKDREFEQSEYVQDIPLMKTIIERLDMLFELPDDNVTTELMNIAHEFNTRWASTPSWEYEIEIFNSPTEVGEEIIRREEESIEEKLVESYDLPSLADFLDDYLDKYEEPEATEKALERMDKERSKATEEIQNTKEYKEAKREAYKEFEDWKSDLLQICANTFINKESQRKFLERIEEIEC